MFLLEFVILFTGGGVCLSACWDTPPGAGTPPEQTHTPRNRPPRSRRTHPPAGTNPQEQAHTPQEQTPPPDPREADYGIRSTSGRYASYWNAFLFLIFSQSVFGILLSILDRWELFQLSFTIKNQRIIKVTLFYKKY